MRANRLRLWFDLTAQLAVIAGIVFLAMEIRQNTRAVIAASGTALTDQSIDFFSAGLDNQVVARALYKQDASEPLDPFEASQLERLQYLNFRVFENAFLQYRRGYYEDTEWDRYRQIILRNLTSNESAMAMWQRYGGGGFTADFTEEVIALLANN